MLKKQYFMWWLYRCYWTFSTVCYCRGSILLLFRLKDCWIKAGLLLLSQKSWNIDLYLVPKSSLNIPQHLLWCAFKPFWLQDLRCSVQHLLTVIYSEILLKYLWVSLLFFFKSNISQFSISYTTHLLQKPLCLHYWGDIPDLPVNIVLKWYGNKCLEVIFLVHLHVPIIYSC